MPDSAQLIRLGIEQEIVFADRDGNYLDADNAGYAMFAAIAEAFPAYPGDELVFACKSLETHPRRCYVEGFERHDASGRTVETQPKALEIRTLPHPEAEATVTEFRESWATVMDSAAGAGLRPVLTSRHPFKTALAVHARVDPVERAVRSEAALALAIRAMFTHGMHVTVSLEGWSLERMARLAEKINYYTPALIPWSFSSPFYRGRLFEGLCSRNYYRAESRRLTDVHLRRGGPVLEFRGFDACGDARLLQAVLTMYRGFLLDDTLQGQAAAQDPERLKRSCLDGFADPALRAEGLAVLAAARAANGKDHESFALLESLLQDNDSYAARMKARYMASGSIMASITGLYDY